MVLNNICERFLSYNLWANERITSWLLTTHKGKCSEFIGSSFGTIDLTIQHIVCAQRYWYEIIVERRIIDFPTPDKAEPTEKIIGNLISTSRQLIEGIANFNEEQLIEKIQASDSTQSRYEYILHVVNHSSYHRGQIVNMVRALGITGEIPVNDYDAYLWWIENM